MANSELFTIGSVVKHRGEYNSETTYYVSNQVTMFGCVFQAIGTNFNNIPPLTIATDKTISLANTNVWKCIIDNVELYNSTLSASNNRIIDIAVSDLDLGNDISKYVSGEKPTIFRLVARIGSDVVPVGIVYIYSNSTKTQLTQIVHTSYELSEDGDKYQFIESAGSLTHEYRRFFNESWSKWIDADMVEAKDEDIEALFK